MRGAALVALLVVIAGVEPVVGGGAGAAPPAESEIQAQKKQLEDLKQKADAARKKAAQLAKQEKGVLQRLREAEDAIAATRRYLRGLEEREAVLAADLAQADRDLGRARRDLQAQRDALRRRLRHAYVHGRVRPFEIVFSSSTFPELLQRTAFMSRVVQQDRRLVSAVEEREAGVRDRLAFLAAKQAEIAALGEEKEAERAQFENLRNRQTRDLDKVRDQKEDCEQAAAELDKAAKQMQNLVADLERRRLAALKRDDKVLAELDRQNFSRNRGILPWPVSGNVLSEFGRHEHPKYRTVILNNGLDIEAPMGAAVQSVGDGVVDLVQWLDGYGLSVIVNHGRGYYTIYAHLSAAHVTQGDRVAPGQVIGSVGDSGSLRGTCLHFELREGSQAQNPRNWLR